MAAYFCPHCRVKATFANQGPNHKGASRIHSIWTCGNCAGVVYASVGREANDVEIYPSLRFDAPEEYPDDVRENFGEALRSINGSNPKAAVIMARSALQAATREHGATGNNLKEEIDDLAARHVIPDALKDWAHEIRDGGNLVGHPKPDKKVEVADAEELIALAESIFEYLYVIPKHVEHRRQRLVQGSDQPEQASQS